MKQKAGKSLAIMLLLGQYKCSKTAVNNEVSLLKAESWNDRQHTWVDVESPLEPEILQTAQYNRILNNAQPGQMIQTENAASTVEEDGHRFLYTQFTQPNTKSNKCKTDCIDVGSNYCANANFSGGYCCGPVEDCPRAEICSFDNKRAPPQFNYIVCPNEAACEGKFIRPKYDESVVLTRAIDKYTYGFVKNDVCSYIVESPWEMQPWDKMKMKIDKIENASVYVAKSKKTSIRWLSHLDKMAESGDVFDTRAGWQFYVVAVSDSVFKGTIRVRVWIEKGTEPAAPVQQTQFSPVPDKPASQPAAPKATPAVQTGGDTKKTGVKALDGIVVVKDSTASTKPSSGTTVSSSKQDATRKAITEVKIQEIKEQQPDATDSEIAAILADPSVAKAMDEAAAALNQVDGQMAFEAQANQKSSNGAIVGLAVACVLFMGLLGFVAWFISSKQRNGVKAIGNTNDITPTPGQYHEQQDDQFDANEFRNRKQKGQFDDSVSEIGSVNGPPSQQNRSIYTKGARTEDGTSNYEGSAYTYGATKAPGFKGASSQQNQIQQIQQTPMADIDSEHNRAALDSFREGEIRSTKSILGPTTIGLKNQLNNPQTDDEQIQNRRRDQHNMLGAQDHFASGHYTDTEGGADPRYVNQRNMTLEPRPDINAQIDQQMAEYGTAHNSIDAERTHPFNESNRRLLQGPEFGAEIAESSDQQSRSLNGKKKKKKKKKKVEGNAEALELEQEIAETQKQVDQLEIRNSHQEINRIQKDFQDVNAQVEGTDPQNNYTSREPMAGNANHDVEEIQPGALEFDDEMFGEK